jgi:anti-sigma factor ChrR (cupin superfamily)
MQADSHAIDTAELPWRPSPYDGVEWKKLHHDPDTGQSAVLLRFAPGASYGAHRHPAGEQYYVLEGTLQDGSSTWSAGSYVCHPPGSVHKPASASGCLLFVTVPAPVEIVE